ncbi:MAG: Ldh family oxidoreductase [Candidatus Puniceispirillaceae bacterium]
MATETCTLAEIEALALRVLKANGCDDANAKAIASIVTRAERDGSASHGLFRLPGYVKSMQSGKVDGTAAPVIEQILPSVISVDGKYGYAPYSLECALPVLAKATHQTGIAVMRLYNSFHFAALWPEVEYLAEQNLVGIACTCFKPSVAPAGATKAFFGTNPLAFAWPRPGDTPVVFDMATSRLAKGDVMLAARDGHDLPDGTGLGPDGQPTNDPNEVLKGVLLPFGGYKGSAISMMVELLSATLAGDQFSYEAASQDNNDGGPARGGELIIAISPQLLSGDGWDNHSAGFFDALTSLDGVRMPGARRHKNRQDEGSREVNATLLETLHGLIG